MPEMSEPSVEEAMAGALVAGIIEGYQPENRLMLAKILIAKGGALLASLEGRQEAARILRNMADAVEGWSLGRPSRA